MNFRSLSAFGVALLLSSGCIIVSGGSGGGGGGGSGGGGGGTGFANVTFNWSFVGQSCGQHPEVATVAIVIDGEDLMDVGHGPGVYDCDTDGFDGIELHDFATGSYHFTLTAQDSSNRPLFTGSGTFMVAGVDIPVNADLVQVADSSSSALLSWTFPPTSASSSPTCAQVGITNVTYYLDADTTGTTVACSDGNAGATSPSGHYTAGNHSFTVNATDANGTVVYTYSTSLTVVAGNQLSVAVPFGWAIGGGLVKWTIEDATGTNMLTCAVANITDVYVNFSLDGQTWVYPGMGDKQPCDTGGMSYAEYDYLLPGQYIVKVTASDGTQSYTSNMVNPPGLAVVLGVFPDGVMNGSDVASVIIKP